MAYLWTRTVKCPNPSCGASVPLVRQTWLCKKSKKYVALKVIPVVKPVMARHEAISDCFAPLAMTEENLMAMTEQKTVRYEVVEATSEKGLGFNPAEGSSRGNSTCRHCGTTFKNDHVKAEGKAGRIGQQLMAIVCTTPGAQGKTYLSGTDYQRYIPDEVAILERLDKLCKETGLTIPDESLPIEDNQNFWITEYGLTKFGQLFTPRQLLSLMTFVKWVRLAHKEIVNSGVDEDLAKAICTYLGILCDRLSDYNSSLTKWTNT